MKPTLPEGLPEKVLECIKLYRTPQVRALKKNIASYCGLNYTSTTDRNIRDAVSELRDRGEPIISESGKAGYYYNRADVEIVKRELRSRIAKMSKTDRKSTRLNSSHPIGSRMPSSA